jgi:hypothetical protein
MNPVLPDMEVWAQANQPFCLNIKHLLLLIFPFTQIIIQSLVIAISNSRCASISLQEFITMNYSFRRGLFHDLARQKECVIIGGSLCADHVHMCIMIPPKYSVSSVIGFLKGKTQ